MGGIWAGYALVAYCIGSWRAPQKGQWAWALVAERGKHHLIIDYAIGEIDKDSDSASALKEHRDTASVLFAVTNMLNHIGNHDMELVHPKLAGNPFRIEERLSITVPNKKAADYCRHGASTFVRMGYIDPWVLESESLIENWQKARGVMLDFVYSAAPDYIVSAFGLSE